MNAQKLAAILFVAIALFSIGKASNGKQYVGDNPDVNLTYLYEANAYKAELIDEYEKMIDAVNYVVSMHMDDSTLDDFVDELDSKGYYKSQKVIDSLIAKEE